MSSTETGTDLVAMSDEQVEAALRGEVGAEQLTVTLEDPQVIAQSIINRILESPDAESVLGGQKALGGREVLGRPLELRGVRWHKSSFDGQVPVFAVLDVVTMDDGEPLAITTGSLNVMAQAFKLHKLGALPQTIRFMEVEKETAAGFRPQYLDDPAKDQAA